MKRFIFLSIIALGFVFLSSCEENNNPMTLYLSHLISWVINLFNEKESIPIPFDFYEGLRRKYEKRGKQNGDQIVKSLSVGCVVKMNRGFHTSKPYYVEITECRVYNDPKKSNYDRITTYIPGKRSHTLIRGDWHTAWDYHLGRMHVIGPKSVYGYLLKNQKLD